MHHLFSARSRSGQYGDSMSPLYFKFIGGRVNTANRLVLRLVRCRIRTELEVETRLRHGHRKWVKSGCVCNVGFKNLGPLYLESCIRSWVTTWLWIVTRHVVVETPAYTDPPGTSEKNPDCWMRFCIHVSFVKGCASSQRFHTNLLIRFGIHAYAIKNI